MSFADDDEFDAFVNGETLFPRLTGEALRLALGASEMNLIRGRNFDWLAKASRRVLYLTVPYSGEGPDRASDAYVRKELQRRAQIAESTWAELSAHNEAIDRRILKLAWDEWRPDAADGVLSALPLYARYKAAIRELDWLGSLLSHTAKSLEDPKHRWSETEKRDLRIVRGRFLAALYELAFGEKPTSNNAAKAEWDHSPTPFAVFYQKVVSLAFDESGTPNLPKVLKDALSFHRQDPVQFPEGIIPDA